EGTSGDMAPATKSCHSGRRHDDPSQALVRGQRDHAGSARARTVGAWGLGPRIQSTTQERLVLSASTSLPSVEVPGIEPGSSAASPGLLRAQFAVSLLGPTGHANEPV